MPSPDRIDPNYPGLDPALVFAPPPDVRMPTKQVVASTYTLLPVDYYRMLAISIAAATTITIPTMALADFPVGGLVTVRRFAGSGSVAVVPAAGVTLTKAAGFATPVSIDGDTGAICLQRNDASSWTVFGQMAKA